MLDQLYQDLVIQHNQMLPRTEYSLKQGTAYFSMHIAISSVYWAKILHIAPSLIADTVLQYTTVTSDVTRAHTWKLDQELHLLCHHITNRTWKHLFFQRREKRIKGQNQCFILFGSGQFCLCTFNHTWQRFHFTAASQAVMKVNAHNLMRESKQEMSWLN